MKICKKHLTFEAIE